MAEQDPHELSESLRRETDELARDSGEVQAQIDRTRGDWERKRADESVPGAPPDVGEPEEDESGEQEPEAEPETEFSAKDESSDDG